jgi:hypothetical protein
MSIELNTATKQKFNKAFKRIILAVATVGAISSFSTENASAHGFVYGGGVVINVGSYCPYGTHLGYLGKHCWSNYRSYGPRGSGFGFGFGFGHGHGGHQAPPVKILSQ